MDFNSIPGVSSAKQYISAAKEYLYNNETAVDAGLKVKAFASDAGQKVKAVASDAFVALQGGVENVKQFGATYKKELIQVAALTMLATAVAAATKCYLDAPVPVIGNASTDVKPANFKNVSGAGVDQGSVTNNAFCRNDINPFITVNGKFISTPDQNQKVEQKADLTKEEVEQKTDLPKVVGNGFTPNEFNPLNTTHYKVYVKGDKLVSNPANPELKDVKREADQADLTKVVDNGFNGFNQLITNHSKQNKYHFEIVQLSRLLLSTITKLNLWAKMNL